VADLSPQLYISLGDINFTDLIDFGPVNVFIGEIIQDIPECKYTQFLFKQFSPPGPDTLEVFDFLIKYIIHVDNEMRKYRKSLMKFGKRFAPVMHSSGIFVP